MAQGWSVDGNIYYVDGFAYAIKPRGDEPRLLKTVCIGKREDILKEHPIK